MLKDLNYVSFDFETTGLDLKKDEPIQFGLVKYDKDFNIIDKYSTYIKPRKKISELKNIVSFITGLKLEDLKNAPYIERVLPEIKKFFDSNTVLVGQNIEFDYNVLKKYWPDFKPLVLVDTFVIAKTIFHFFPSYSLEVLFDFVKDEL
jgi:DNA polymerase III alpha subunit (gram-positive type)